MEVPLTKTLLDKIVALSNLVASDELLDSEPASQYASKIDDLLKSMRPVFEAIGDADVALDELLVKGIEDLDQLISGIHEILETWHPLHSKVYFVLQVEPLISKIYMLTLEILKLFETLEDHPVQLNTSVLQNCLKEAKEMGFHDTSTSIKQFLDNPVVVGDASESLAQLFDCLNLNSNQLLLIEAVALEKLKEDAEQAEDNDQVEHIDQIISLVTQMHNEVTAKKQSESCSPVPIPPDFCCPLSLELMTDPVIVASGQTYERAYIKNWIDMGLTVCPKTRQTLAHTNLIPNYTVKALIASWCESKNVKLPDPMRSPSSAHSSPLHARAESSVSRNSPIRHHTRVSEPLAHDTTKSAASPGHNMTVANGFQREEISSTRHPRSSSEGSLPHVVEKGNGSHNGMQSVMASEDGPLNTVQEHLASSGSSWSPSKEVPNVQSSKQSSRNHNRTASDSSKVAYSNSPLETPGIPVVSSSLASSAYNSDNSGEVLAERPVSGAAANTRREPGYSPRFEVKPRSQSIWRRPSDRFVPRTGSSSVVDNRPDLSGIEAEVKKLVEDLKSDSIESKKKATFELRQLTKHSMDNRIVIANCGAIPLLVGLLHSSDLKMQEDAVTALLNLSINDNNKTAIANADAIGPLIHVLQTGNPEARENSAATLFSLSVTEENKIKIGRSGAIGPLVDLLGNGTPRGKKDAATALFNLSIYHENKARIVAAGAVRYLVELMDPAAGMVDKAVAVLANLSTIKEGRMAIGQERGIPLLVEVVELGSARGKENAAAALLQLCTDSNRVCSEVLQEGAVPPLVALSQSGTPRAKEKAQALLSHFRNQRHGAAGRN